MEVSLIDNICCYEIEDNVLYSRNRQPRPIARLGAPKTTATKIMRSMLRLAQGAPQEGIPESIALDLNERKEYVFGRLKTACQVRLRSHASIFGGTV